MLLRRNVNAEPNSSAVPTACIAASFTFALTVWAQLVTIWSQAHNRGPYLALHFKVA